MERTTLTNRSALDRLLQSAARAGELNQLYWFVEMRVSPTLTGTKRPVVAAASYPKGYTPIIPVTDDPATSRHYAEVLLELMKAANRGRLIEFGLALTAQEIINQEAGMPTYEWGDAVWDCVCDVCGAVWQSTGAGDEICERCQRGGRY